MMVCTLCGLTVQSLDGFQIVRIGNRATVVLGPDGAHNFTRVQNPIPQSHNAQSLNAIRVNHERFHTARNIVNPSCSLCILKSKKEDLDAYQSPWML